MRRLSFILIAIVLSTVLSQPTFCPVDWNAPCNVFLFRGNGWVSYPSSPAQIEKDYQYLFWFLYLYSFILFISLVFFFFQKHLFCRKILQFAAAPPLYVDRC